MRRLAYAALFWATLLPSVLFSMACICGAKFAGWLEERMAASIEWCLAFDAWMARVRKWSRA